jgi:hypothetical protein
MGGDPLSNIASPPRLEERERKKMKTFTFSVPASLIYKVEAETELKALKLLVKEGGLSILADDTIVDVDDYEMAECIDEI